MPLILSPRFRRGDLEHWREREAMDRVYVERMCYRLDELTAAAASEIRRFAPDYIGTSWGKDSMAVAHLALTAGIAAPLVCIRVEPIANPDIDLVRDAFLARHPVAAYDEIAIWCRRDADGWHARGTLEEGFARARERHGDRYVSGIRSAESSIRALRVAGGLSTARTCAPIGRWTGADVFAYLHRHDLPIHPAYACSFAGALDRERIRVASLTGRRGAGRGRAEWERAYYGRELAALARPGP